MQACIKAISYYLPETVYSNTDYFRDFPDQEKSKNLHKTGVSERRIISPGETSSDIGIRAAEKLFSEHSIAKEGIDFLIFCSSERDHPIMKTSNIIHDKLQLSANCGTIDMIDGCAAFPIILAMAKGLIIGSGFKNVLIITSSSLTKVIYEKDKSSRFLFGDAAVATLVSMCNNGSIGETVLGTDGKNFDKIIQRDGGGRHPLSGNSYTEFTDKFGNISTPAHFYMNSLAVFGFGIHTVPELIQDTLTKNKMQMSDIDLFIFHQANLFLIETIMRSLSIASDKVFNYIELVGNTSSASVPLTLYKAIENGAAKKGDKLMLCGFGAGLSWGATIITL